MRMIINCTTLTLLIAVLSTLAGCNKYLNEPLPSNTITAQNAFTSDNAVSSVVTGNFLNLIENGTFNGSLYYDLGLYTDELQNLNSTGGTNNVGFYTDAEPTDPGFWETIYNQVYGINAALAGIETTTATLLYKNQWLGESYFSRAFVYFYLTNLYGAVPLALTTDVLANDALSRSPQTQVYQQIVSDLQQAQSLLNDGYTSGFGAATGDRVRPNRYAALALLSKVYLYTQKWDSAEMAADSVIGNSLYSLSPLNTVFNANSTETIWALSLPTESNGGGSLPGVTFEYTSYVNGMPNPIVSPNTAVATYNVNAALQPSLVSTFENGDNRLADWVNTVPISGSSPAVTYYFPYKYSSSSPGSQNEMVLRLGEIYLIRAEARAEQNNVSGAQADLNAVRTRAGLGNTTATDQASLLNAIAHERQVELFTEGGNRFFDLKRTGKIDSVMTAYAPLKDGTWSDYMQIFALPLNDIQQDANLTQNPGYAQ